MCVKLFLIVKNLFFYTMKKMGKENIAKIFFVEIKTIFFLFVVTIGDGCLINWVCVLVCRPIRNFWQSQQQQQQFPTNRIKCFAAY